MLKTQRFQICVCTLILTAVAHAGPITNLIVYGDSLSDNGNFFKATGVPPPPYFAGRFSNGPVAVEDLASALKVPLIDFAWGGATTGIGNINDPGGTVTNLGALGLPGMTTVFAGTVGSIAPLASTSLFVVWGGPNDFRGPSPADATPVAIANRAVSDLLGIVNGLEGIGAQRILVAGLPDLGLTPLVRRMGPAAVAQGSAITDYFDAQLQAKLPPGVIYFDTAGLLRSIVGNPAAFGFTNVTSPCFDSTVPSLCANPDQFLFWDDVHPTARADAMLAQDFAAALAVPEPSTWALVVSSLVLLGFARRVDRRIE